MFDEFKKKMTVGRKLSGFLTAANLTYLDRLLGGLTDPSTPGYNAFWSWYVSPFNVDSRNHVFQHVVKALQELRKILREYRVGNRSAK